MIKYEVDAPTEKEALDKVLANSQDGVRVTQVATINREIYSMVPPIQDDADNTKWVRSTGIDQKKSKKHAVRKANGSAT